MLITSTNGTLRVAHDGQTFEPTQGYTFDLPADLAEHLIRFDAWRATEPEDLDLPDVPVAPRRGRPRKTAVADPE